jgi:uncharacterized protein (DUF433 family)
MTRQEIVTDPAIMNGRAHVSGTRLLAETVLEELAAGQSVEQVAEAHAGLDRGGVLAALRYGALQLRYAWDEIDKQGLCARQVAFVGALTYTFPVFTPLFQEHLESLEGEVLSHIYMTEAEAWLESEIGTRRDIVASVFAWLEAQYAEGDPDVRELLSESFIENLPYPGRPHSELRELLGPTMAARDAELLHQARERAERETGTD